MTAEIVIMNREAVVLAADSAVTINGGQKVLNTANKMFMLLPKHPVGVLIYNNATIMDVPWEIIINEYREHNLGKEIKFPELKDYATDFLKYIEKQGSKFFSKNQELIFFRRVVFSEYGEILRAIWQKMRNIFYSNAQISDEEIRQIAIETINKYHADWSEWNEILPGKNGNKFRRKILTQFKDLISQLINTGFEKFNLSSGEIKKLKEIALFSVSKIEQEEEKVQSYSGLVFAGFGENNLFPVCISFNTYNYLSGVLAYTQEEYYRIGLGDGDGSSIILPFAQQDVTHNLLSGRLPAYELALKSKLSEKFDEKDVKEILDNVNNTAWDNHTKPILDTIEILPKDELAAVAKTLVDLTSFMRHVSSGIETVGGPVDVAVISRKDGFIWIDRKHYFDIKKNIHFIN
jgi:hypothetical protein